MARAPLLGTAALLALPLAGLALLLALPDADAHWQHNPSHFWLVLVAAGLNAALAYATGASARRRGDGQVHVVSLAFLVAAAFLGLHALATPGVLLDRSNLGFAISTPLGLLLAGALAAASTLEPFQRRAVALERALLAGTALWAAASLLLLPDQGDIALPDRLSAPLVVLSILGVAFFGYAIVRYGALWRERRSNLLLAFAVAFVLLAEATGAIAISRTWQLSWWEWHLLMLVAFALIAASAHREWHAERFSGLYVEGGPRELSVLFADLQGFTSYSEQHGATEVTAMLNAYFAAAIPEIERHGGEIDRLIGDAVMAVFDGEDHPERAARAAIALQDATAALADANPGWPRFRAGVNTGEARVGVLGSGSGRTYSVVGDAVNVAARIEGLAPAGGVALGGETASRLRGAQLEPLGRMDVKGRAAPVDIFLLHSLG
jgi:class 3 adenylate cyclase